MWLQEALRCMSLGEDAETYVLARGMPLPLAQEIGIVQWDDTVIRHLGPCPDPGFAKEFGNGYASRVCGRLAIPLWSPRGALLGVEIRTWETGVERVLLQYLLPATGWNPLFVGMSPRVMAQIWEGADVWICEGVFDLGALSRVVSDKEVVLSTLRARLSPQHVEFLSRFCSGRVLMAYDNDVTGQRATHGYVDPDGKKRLGALEYLRRAGLNALAVTYRHGKDPGDIWFNQGQIGLEREFQRWSRKM